jgi:hypothetical protein
MFIEDFPRSRSAPDGPGGHCKPCHYEITRLNKEKHGGARNYHLRRRYGITAEQADQMLAEQGGLCAICLEAPAQHVDHDHRTGRVRGLLCFNCNGALGQFRDRADLMMRAFVYLGRDLHTPVSGMPEFCFGVFHGDFTSPRPEGEPPLLA